jgi:hypothetical protein
VKSADLSKDHRDNAAWYRDHENDPGHAGWHDEAADLIDRQAARIAELEKSAAIDRAREAENARQLAEAKAALEDATLSLETTSKWPFVLGDLAEGVKELRAWARSRAGVAREALEKLK